MVQVNQAEAELRALEESGAVGITDGWGEFTPVDTVAKSHWQNQVRRNQRRTPAGS
jgi:hypothetical protein